MQDTTKTLGLLGALGVGCDGAVRLVYAPYEGPEPYPNRRPKLMLPAGDVALVSNSFSDDVTVLDLAAGVPVGTAPVGMLIVRTELALDDLRSHASVAE